MGKVIFRGTAALVAAILAALIGVFVQWAVPQVGIVTGGLVRGEEWKVDDQYTALFSNDEGGTEPIEAAFKLSFNEQDVVGSGKRTDKNIEWRIKGLYNGNFLMMAYRSAGVGNGYGTYFLMQTQATRDVFRGQVEGASCNAEKPCADPKLVRCNVIIRRGAPISAEVKAIREQYRDFLSPAGCTITDLPNPDKPMAPRRL